VTVQPDAATVARAAADRPWRFAFDVGGTFTDLVLLGPAGEVHTAKVLSDHDDVVAPIRRGLEQLLAAHGMAMSAVNGVVAGATTAVTNLVIERKGARTGLITTAGFRDVLEIARELRFDLYDLNSPGPDPIIQRALRMEIDERIDALGAVVRAPSDASIEAALRQLADAGVEAIAVCLLHSFTNPAHELRVKALAQRLLPGVALSLSHEVLGELREYERMVATVLNAYVMPMVGPYLARIEDGLRAAGLPASLRVMQSNGGVITRALGARMPIRMLESGPAAGALGAAFAAGLGAPADVMAFDMGGTTAKACLVVDGQPSITHDFEAARRQRFKKGSGLPVRLPTIDLIEIGAGGGSIARVDASGLLKVGPESAGSNPGPACYGLGGLLPTVTDAALVLGYLAPGGRLSDAVTLRLDLAEQAIETHVARPLGITLVEAASGIHRIVCEHMAMAAKIHAVEKGRDVRRCSLMAFGGAGPIHAREVARRAGCGDILVPAHAGVFSAFGLLVAPMKVDRVRTRFARLDELDWAEAERLLQTLSQALIDELVEAGAPAAQVRLRRSADMRYVGQGFEVETELPATLGPDARAGVEAAFTQAYARCFGRPLSGQRIEAVNWRVEGFAPALGVPAAATPAQPAGGQNAGALDRQPPPARPAPPAQRPVYFPDLGRFVDTPVLAAAAMRPGQQGIGPLLIEQAGSTVVIGPTDAYALEPSGHLRIRSGAAAGPGH
jgi:N-methylhydantoinase A